MDTKSRSKSIQSVFRRGLEKGTSKRTLSRTRKSEILLLFTILQQGRRSEKRSLFGDHFGDHLGDNIVEIGVPMSSKKSSENRHPNSVILGSILGTIGLPWDTFWSVIRKLFSGLIPGGLPRWILGAFQRAFGVVLGGNFEVFGMYSGSSLARRCVVFPM